MTGHKIRLAATCLGIALLGACGETQRADRNDPNEYSSSTLHPAQSGPERVLQRYDQGVYAATHNSYSGGQRGTIKDQLDDGVRFIELDVWDDRFEEHGDLYIGHDSIGHEVALGGGNPPVSKLGDWLAVVRHWSDAHTGHAPIVVSLDIKSDMSSTDNGGADGGSIDSLLIAAFEKKIFSPSMLNSNWPSIRDLRDRILIMLSGHEPTRNAYRARENPIGFIDFQKADEAKTPEYFVGVRTGEANDLKQFAAPGRLTRIWRFGEDPFDYEFRVHFPATDRPFSAEYKSYCEKHQCVQ